MNSNVEVTSPNEQEFWVSVGTLEFSAKARTLRVEGDKKETRFFLSGSFPVVLRDELFHEFVDWLVAYREANK